MLTHQDYKELANRAAQLARTCSEPNVTEALIALASNYMSIANRLGGASKKPAQNEQEQDLLPGSETSWPYRPTAVRAVELQERAGN
jgi:hypothetical protein